MQFFTLSFDKIVLRYFLMMGVVIASVFAGQPLFAILALPIFLSAVLGISFRVPTSGKAKIANLNVVSTNKNKQAEPRHQAA